MGRHVDPPHHRAALVSTRRIRKLVEHDRVLRLRYEWQLLRHEFLEVARISTVLVMESTDRVDDTLRPPEGETGKAQWLATNGLPTAPDDVGELMAGCGSQ